MDICLVKDMLRAVLQRGLSHDRIALNMAILKDAVAEYQSLTSAAGLDWATTAELDEKALERRLIGEGAAISRMAALDYARVHIELAGE